MRRAFLRNLILAANTMPCTQEVIRKYLMSE